MTPRLRSPRRALAPQLQAEGRRATRRTRDPRDLPLSRARRRNRPSVRPSAGRPPPRARRAWRPRDGGCELPPRAPRSPCPLASPRRAAPALASLLFAVPASASATSSSGLNGPGLVPAKKHERRAPGVGEHPRQRHQPLVAHGHHGLGAQAPASSRPSGASLRHGERPQCRRVNRGDTSRDASRRRRCSSSAYPSSASRAAHGREEPGWRRRRISSRWPPRGERRALRARALDREARSDAGGAPPRHSAPRSAPRSEMMKRIRRAAVKRAESPARRRSSTRWRSARAAAARGGRRRKERCGRSRAAREEAEDGEAGGKRARAPAKKPAAKKKVLPKRAVHQAAGVRVRRRSCAREEAGGRAEAGAEARGRRGEEAAGTQAAGAAKPPAPREPPPAACASPPAPRKAPAARRRRSRRPPDRRSAVAAAPASPAGVAARQRGGPSAAPPNTDEKQAAFGMKQMAEKIAEIKKLKETLVEERKHNDVLHERLTRARRRWRSSSSSTSWRRSFKATRGRSSASWRRQGKAARASSGPPVGGGAG